MSVYINECKTIANNLYDELLEKTTTSGFVVNAPNPNKSAKAMVGEVMRWLEKCSHHRIKLKEGEKHEI